MYGYFVPAPRRRGRIWQEEVLGMPLLRCELPGRMTARTCRKLERCFGRWRVHRLLNAPQSWPGGGLPPLSETRSLWTAKAPEAALALLERGGISPAAATVEFCGDRFTAQARRIILALVPRVRAVSLELPADEAFLWHLQREYGLSPLEGRGDLAICFSPVRRALTLPLWQERPAVEGLTLAAPGVHLPEDCPELPLLCALTEQGRLRQEQIEIRSDFA